MAFDAPYVLAIDLGTTAVKVAVVDPTGRVVASASELHETRNLPDGGVEQDAEMWWQSIGRCARDAVRTAHLTGDLTGDLKIGVIAVTAQYMSAVAIDANGLPLSPVIMWMDRRGDSLHPLNERYDLWEQWLDVHGLIPLPNDDVGHIAVLRARYPEHREGLAAYVEPADAIGARLVGSVSATPCTAFPLMCTDNRSWLAVDYDDAALTLAGLSRSDMPPLVAADKPLGCVTDEAAAHLGVGTDTLVMPATIDSVTSAVGCGALDATSAAFVLGTTAVMATHISEKRVELAQALSTIPSPLPGRYFVMAENGMGGKALDLFVHQLVYPDDAFSLGGVPSDAFERAEDAAASVAPGAEGVQFLPWLVGSIAPSPDDDVRGAFLGINAGTTRAHLARAVYEGVALNAAWLLEPFSVFAQQRYTSITFGGGGARSDLWAQILADACNVTVCQLDDPSHANARGAAFLAQAQLGNITFESIPERIVVRRRYEPNAANVPLYAGLRARLIAAHAAIPR